MQHFGKGTVLVAPGARCQKAELGAQSKTGLYQSPTTQAGSKAPAALCEHLTAQRGGWGQRADAILNITPRGKKHLCISVLARLRGETSAWINDHQVMAFPHSCWTCCVSTRGDKSRENNTRSTAHRHLLHTQSTLRYVGRDQWERKWQKEEGSPSEEEYQVSLEGRKWSKPLLMFNHPMTISPSAVRQ